MPNDERTEGERIADGFADVIFNSHGSRMPPSQRRHLAERIDTTIASKDAIIAEREAEIGRFIKMCETIIHSESLKLSRPQHSGVLRAYRNGRLEAATEIANLLKEPVDVG